MPRGGSKNSRMYFVLHSFHYSFCLATHRLTGLTAVKIIENEERTTLIYVCVFVTFPGFYNSEQLAKQTFAIVFGDLALCLLEQPVLKPKSCYWPYYEFIMHSF